MPKGIPPAIYPYDPKYNPNVSCAFHAAYIGHSIEDYSLLKTMVQELIDQKTLSFSGEGPNIRTDVGECSH